jgi:GNAT superfamily N-acetyltransferase
MIEDGLHDVPAGKLAMVVTHLEMTAPATLRDIDPPAGVDFRQVDPDVAWYRAIFTRVGADWLWYGRRLLDDQALCEVIEDPNVVIYTLRKDGEDEAILELDFRQQDECELAYFGLSDRLIGTGAGRFLMDRAIALAWAEPIKRFHLHTCTIDSPQALGFYQRSGFTAYKRQIEIADDPRLTGLLPEDSAPHIPLLR